MAAAAAAAATVATAAAAAVAAAAETLFFNHFFRFLAAVRSTPPKIEKNAKFNFFVEQASQLSPLPTRQEKNLRQKKIAERFFFGVIHCASQLAWTNRP